MTAPSKERNGSFRGIGARDLLLFDPALHRHDRGWQHPPPAQAEEPGSRRTKDPPNRGWKTVGIFHFPHADGDEEEAAPGNAGFR